MFNMILLSNFNVFFIKNFTNLYGYFGIFLVQL
jgi:hypothetical protein